ncbi:probable LRR receptor-like serine/threonine-protein kinase At5g48740 isoform X2 [Benincasa hispida]|uniref:probable LRR receptor-like serine/threonine-protein kinase At5g48740 isoform X2 n=1 Tax=Benincasa hispida TaxID=102211 RepID=UPI00190248EE|nr:probable LRR receptor-like serine/threonine-protein kinase At5g48740 isoform X2 [Benincasa hispida]
MEFHLLWVGFFLCSGFWVLTLSDQDGFLSLSCGATTTFTDSSNILWLPDVGYISSGNTSIIDNGHARFFPDPRARNCYKLPLKNTSSSVLIRAKFVYKNYDKLGKPPAFFVSLGTAITSIVNLTFHEPWTEEFVWPVNKETVSFCLHSIPLSGSPLISSIELRPLPRGSYEDDGLLQSRALRKSYRINCGYTNGSLRYPIDPYDRVWDADRNFKPFHVSSGFKVEANFDLIGVKEAPPAAVVETARVLTRRDELSYNFPLEEEEGDYYVILYFGGILAVHPSFDVLINGRVIESNYTFEKGEIRALYVIQEQIKSLNITLKSVKYYPQVNAIEVYQIVHVPLEASSTTALQVIHQSTGLNLGWEDDPCSPRTWDHVGCEGNLVTSLELSNINLRTISPTFGDILDLKLLDLHNTSLSGEIQNLGSLTHLQNLNLSFNKLTSFGSDLENLSNLKILDLQNNSLQGIVPDGLGELEDLQLLNLENNRLEGTLPLSLNKGSLEIRTIGNPCLSFSTMTCNDVSSNPAIETPQVTVVPEKKEMNSHNNTNNHIAIIIIVSAVASALLVLITLCLSLLLYMRRHSQHTTTELTYSTKAAMELRNWNSAKVFSYKEIKAATNNFKEVIGRGSFGSVYLGKLPDGKLVAVKVRFDKTQLGTDSFINEVHLLSQIRHQNLVCLEGFCNESKRQILVYEYLPGGSLADHIYGMNKKSVSLSWIRRLKVAVDAAKGLDYLHNGSEPRIIHRDVKCSNILLDMEMNAKVCDFGLSKQISHPDATHVTTVVKGTAGYLDPEYYSTQQLTEKSDVYSFGVVLLELICGREPLSRTGTPDSFNLVLWAKPYLQAGAFEIVDENLRGSFDVESMKKAALVAIRCVERDASQRPNIGQVLADLNDAYDAQIAYLSNFDH